MAGAGHSECNALFTTVGEVADNDSVEWRCPKHESSSFGFAFLCAHLASGTGAGFHQVLDEDGENEPRPPALCDNCEQERKRSGAYQSSRVCAACYDEVKAQRTI